MESPKLKKARKALESALRTFILERDGYACLRCGRTDDLAADHINPVSKGGGDGVENLQTLCRSCNSSKRDKYADYRVGYDSEDAKPNIITRIHPDIAAQLRARAKEQRVGVGILIEEAARLRFRIETFPDKDRLEEILAGSEMTIEEECYDLF